MAANSPRAATLWLALLSVGALVLPACERSLDFSSWQTRPLVATRIELQRSHTSPGEEPPATQPSQHLQTLAIDLESGQALFTDVNGRSYPQQLDPALVQKLHDGIVHATWDIGRIKPALHAENPQFYTLTVYSGSQAFKDKGRWAVPAHDSLPQCDSLLVDAFEDAVRLAHPLSERLNLLN